MHRCLCCIRAICSPLEKLCGTGCGAGTVLLCKHRMLCSGCASSPSCLILSPPPIYPETSEEGTGCSLASRHPPACPLAILASEQRGGYKTSLVLPFALGYDSFLSLVPCAVTCQKLSILIGSFPEVCSTVKSISKIAIELGFCQFLGLVCLFVFVLEPLLSFLLF